jgi:hypothetical protein
VWIFFEGTSGCIGEGVGFPWGFPGMGLRMGMAVWIVGTWDGVDGTGERLHRGRGGHEDGHAAGNGVRKVQVGLEAWMGMRTGNGDVDGASAGVHPHVPHAHLQGTRTGLWKGDVV